MTKPASAHPPVLSDFELTHAAFLHGYSPKCKYPVSMIIRPPCFSLMNTKKEDMETS